MITICAEELRELDACEEGYQTFIEAHNSAAVKLSEALESNGIEDVCWLLGKLELGDQKEKDLRDFARGQAAINLEKIAPYCSVDEYATICDWVLEGDESARSAAWSAAWSAWSAAESAAESAARSAARSAAESAFKNILISWESES